ncbi:hypothetical protein [Dongia sp. agr-C8]
MQTAAPTQPALQIRRFLASLAAGVLAVVAVIGYQKWMERKATEEALATVAFRIQPMAEDVAAGSCSILAWIDHLQHKRGQSLTPDLILSDARAPWQNTSSMSSFVTSLQNEMREARGAEARAVQEQLTSLGFASRDLQDSVNDLLTALIAVDTGRPASAISSFESAREQAKKAVANAQEAGNQIAGCEDR